MKNTEEKNKLKLEICATRARVFKGIALSCSHPIERKILQAAGRGSSEISETSISQELIDVLKENGYIIDILENGTVLIKW